MHKCILLGSYVLGKRYGKEVLITTAIAYIANAISLHHTYIHLSFPVQLRACYQASTVVHMFIAVVIISVIVIVVVLVVVVVFIIFIVIIVIIRVFHTISRQGGEGPLPGFVRVCHGSKIRFAYTVYTYST